MRIGSLFSGAGGLDMAVEAVFGATTAWHCEIDPAASKVLAARWPGISNLGDITQVDWAAVTPVDVLCGGFPCQDVSSAGRRAGITDGTRSGLWAYFTDAIDALHPQFIIIENVRGLLSARAHRDMERNDPIVGNSADGFVLRAAGAVLGDLADLGYDAQWATVAASDIGAPHRRERVFILATNTERIRQQPSDESAITTNASSRPRHSSSTMPTTDTHRARPGRETDDACGRESDFAGRDMRVQPNGRRPANADSPRDGRDEGRPESARLERGSDAAVGGAGPVELLPTPQASDSDGGRRRSQEVIDAKSRQIQLTDIPRLLPTPQARDWKGGQSNQFDISDALRLLPTPRSSDCFGPGTHGDGGMDLRTTVTLLPTPVASDGNDGGGRDPVKDDVLAQTVKGINRWGKYEAAIRRWESLTRPAPSPTEPNTKGNPRLASAFSEWLMGWPDGWVTDPPLGISHNDQLRIIGNGCVPQQVIAALTWLLQVSEAGALDFLQGADRARALGNLRVVEKLFELGPAEMPAV